MQTLTEQERAREDAKLLCEALEAGVAPDPEVVRRVQERAKAIREKAERVHGTNEEFGVKVLREFRDAE